MALRISGKHMEIGDAFRMRIESKVGDSLEKYFDGGYSGHVTVTKAGPRYTADCMLHLDSGTALQASSDAHDPVVAFEGAADRLEKRLRRYNRKLKSRSPANGNAETIAYTIMESLPDDDNDDDEIAEDFAPAIVSESTMSLKTMTVASAVFELDLKDSPVLVFRNAGSEAVNIVYRRPDGNIGWIDPSMNRAQ